MTTTHTDRPLAFVDTHRDDEAEVPTLLDAIAAGDLDGTAVLPCDLDLPPETYPCGCTDIEHDAMCPANPDPSVCDACGEVYDPDDVYPADNCPGGHCAECGCVPCSVSRRPRY